MRPQMAVAICGLNFALRYPGNENFDPYKSWGGFAWVVDLGFCAYRARRGRQMKEMPCRLKCGSLTRSFGPKIQMFTQY